MKSATNGLYRFAKCSSLWLLLILAIDAHADGMPNTSPPPPPPAPITAPAFNHPKLVLADGRVLAAGGMAASKASAEHTLGADSELWDPETGQWQVLSGKLRFDPDQLVHLNQLEDARVLFFATREGTNAPEYQARIWTPGSGTVEILPVGIKPEPDSDIAVLADGRVLIVNGSEGSADIWDSSTNALTHNEEPLLENSRWRALPLKNKQVLLVEMFPDASEIRRNVTSSVTLFWNPENGEWRQIPALPALFRSNNELSEMANGSVQATILGKVYRLSALDESWDSASIIDHPPQATQSSTGNQLSQPQSTPAKPATAFASEPTYAKKVGEDLKFSILFFPLLILLIMINSRQDIPFFIQSTIHKFQVLLGVMLLSFLTWVLLRHAPIETLQSKLDRWRIVYEGEIMALGLILMLLTPFAVSFIFRRLEKNEHTTFLKYANFGARAIGIGFVVLILLLAVLTDLEMHAYSSASNHSWWVPSDFLQVVLLTVFTPAALYIFLRFLEKRKFANISKYANRAFLIIVFGGGFMLILWGIYVSSESNLAKNVRDCMGLNPLKNATQWGECVEEKNGVVESWLFHKTNKIISSFPTVPCRYIGIWTSTRPGASYRVTLTDDNRFVAEPVHDTEGKTDTITGSWGAHDDRMVWLEDNKFAWPIVINTILPEGRSRFNLVDESGLTTQFELIDAIKSNTCTF